MASDHLPAAPWLVQPAPGAPADADLMDAIVTALEALESEPGQVPFVRAVD